MKSALICASAFSIGVILFLATAVHAAPTVCQIGNGCLGTSTSPAYGNILIGAQNGEYEFVASSTLGSAASSTLLSDNNIFSGIDSFTNASSSFAGTWQSLSPSYFQTALTFPLSVQNGGTGSSTLTGILVGSTTNAVQSYGGTSCTNQFVSALNGAGVATCATVALGSMVSGVLPIANGGTNISTQTTNGVNYFDGTEITSGTSLTWNGTAFSIVPSNGLLQLNGNGTKLQWLESGSAVVSWGTSSSNPFMTWFNSNGSTDLFDWNSGNNHTLRLLNGSNEGIGTSTPFGLLSIAGSAGGTTPLFAISSSTAAFATTTVFEIDQNGNLTQGGNGATAIFNGTTGVGGVPGGSALFGVTSAASSNIRIADFLETNLASGNNVNMDFGKSDSNGNAIQIGYQIGSPNIFYIRARGASSNTGDGLNILDYSSYSLMAFGTSTTQADFQVATTTANATTSIEFGKASQNKGTCLTLFDEAGNPVYETFAPGATTPTYQNGGTAPAGCSD